jgi:colicin import membrane protein
LDLDKAAYEVSLVRAPAEVSTEPGPTEPAQADEPRMAQKAPTPKIEPERPRAKRLPAAQEEAKPARTKEKEASLSAEKRPRPRPKTAQQSPKPEKVLSQALSEVSKQAEGQPDQDWGQGLEAELEELRASLSTQKESGGQGQPAGAIEVYAAVVEQRVKSQWRYPALGESVQLQARAVLTINSSGRIIEVELEAPSGKRDFDLSVLRAIEDAGKLPPPPGKELRQINITFNLQARG